MFNTLNKKKYFNLGLVLVSSILLVLLYNFSNSFHVLINSMFKALTSGNIDEVKGYIRSYGILAPIISFCLMILQSIAAPIPAFLITFSNAAIFGWFWGALLSWTSSMAGAVLCFFIARSFGRVIVEKINGHKSVQQIETFFEKHGKYTILIARLLPFVSFDVVSYVAGTTSISFWGFFWATGLGQLPATIIYSFVGDFLTGGLKYFVMGLMILFAVSVLVFWIKSSYNKKNSDSTF